ncbi:GTPase-associated system all-helical protein GASH [Paraburkholderia caribensis]|uniref:GTPase-associated system all-helical protein GASH n=1 Tax=Paraburkholderia caribensis TaxID=75105 RepID=UPI0034D20C5E
MEKIAVYMRISGVAVSDADVDSRRAAATSLASVWKKETATQAIVAKAAQVAKAIGGDGIPPPSLGDEVQAAIQKKSSSFLYEERPLEVGVCAGAAMISIVSGSPTANGWTIADVYAAALWLAIGYQPVLENEKREILRRDVLDAAVCWATTSSEKARERTVVPDPAPLAIAIGDDKAVTHNFKEAMIDTVEALRRNAALDREELDFLWWVQLGRSRLLNRQLSAITEPTRMVAAGIEAARLLRRLPCEVHRDIVLRTLDHDPELDLTEMLSAFGADRQAMCTGLSKATVTAHPSVFPLLHAMISGEVDNSGAAVKRPVSEWGARALQEATLSRLMAQGAGKV